MRAKQLFVKLSFKKKSENNENHVINIIIIIVVAKIKYFAKIKYLTRNGMCMTRLWQKLLDST